MCSNILAIELGFSIHILQIQAKSKVHELELYFIVLKYEKINHLRLIYFTMQTFDMNKMSITLLVKLGAWQI